MTIPSNVSVDFMQETWNHLFIYQAHSVCLPSNFKVDCSFKIRKLKDEKEQVQMVWDGGLDWKADLIFLKSQTLAQYYFLQYSPLSLFNYGLFDWYTIVPRKNTYFILTIWVFISFGYAWIFLYVEGGRFLMMSAIIGIC